jgi:cytochrome c553
MRSFAVLTVVVAVVAVVVSSCAGPSVAPARDRTVEHTPERLARGAYLGTHVAACLECHSTRDWTRFAGPRVEGTEGRGGETMTKASHGFAGTLVAPNITPAALSSWTDGEVERAVTVGVAKDGHALFPIMPYPSYAHLCQDDVDAVVAWVRTLSPIEHTPPPTSLGFPLSLIVGSIPKDTPRPPCPPAADAPDAAGDETARTLARGRYLVDVAGCVECHSPTSRGQVVDGRAFAGGRTFTLPTGRVTTPNLTTGGSLGAMNADVFVAVFRAHADAPVVEAGGMQSNMPWTAYAGMTDDDLKAIHAWLASLSPLSPAADAPPRWVPRTGD